MKIYLVRHGIATEKIGGAIRYDSQRPLTEEGIDELKQVAKGLQKLGVKPSVFIASPLVRAKQTAEIIREQFEHQEELKISDALAPGGNPGDALKFARKFERAEEIFFVGHEPDMGRLAGTLLWAGPELEIPFKKAGVCRIDVADLPPSYPGTLKWFITPKIASMIAKS